MRVLVTGGAGFLGRAICECLLRRGLRVRSFSRGDYPELAARGIETAQGDVARFEQVAAAALGCDAIIHTAACAGLWGRREDFERTNIEGTQNVIEACRGLGIQRLVYTSSPMVVFAGKDQDGVDESVPYRARYSWAPNFSTSFGDRCTA